MLVRYWEGVGYGGILGGDSGIGWGQNTSRGYWEWVVALGRDWEGILE